MTFPEVAKEVVSLSRGPLEQATRCDGSWRFAPPSGSPYFWAFMFGYHVPDVVDFFVAQVASDIDFSIVRCQARATVFISSTHFRNLPHLRIG